MRRPKISTFVIIILSIFLVGSNSFWFYSAIDAGVTDFYRKQTIYTYDRDRKTLATLLLGSLAPQNQDQFLEWAGQYELKSFKKEDSYVVVQPISFHFKGNEIVRIESSSGVLAE